MAKSSVRGVHGVTLADIHGDDVELHESNTKATWKHCLDPNPRRIILSNRPVRSDEGLYVKLSGTGSARLGFTNSSPYEDNTLENFDGTVLFEDYLFEKSMRKQVQLNLEEEKYEAMYFAEFETNQKTIQMKQIPRTLSRDNLFLFCEIIFGTIRISFESKGSNPLVHTTVHGDQVEIDENNNAHLTNTTGGIVIPEIEMKIDTPVQIVVKPKHKISDGCFFMRYGLTNISPDETKIETLVKYCIANTKLDDDSKETVPFWFENTAVRADAFPGVFIVSITENLDVKTNINSDCIMANLPLIGPDLRQPVWLVLEVFQADDVTVEVHPSIQNARKQDAVSEAETVTFSERIVVGWADKEIDDKAIGDFVSLKADERPEIAHGRRKNRVLLTFKAKRKVDYLKQKLTEPAFWDLIDVEGVAETCSVLVCGLPLDEKLASVGIFFKNKNKVGMTLDVRKCELRPNTGEGVLVLGTVNEVHLLCKKTLEYKKGSILKISPYYSILDDPSMIPDDARNAESPDNFDKVFDEERKVKYIRNYQKPNIENELAKVCSSIKWRKDQGKEVRFEFKCRCGKSEICKGIWVERSNQVFSKMVDNVYVENRKFSQSIWDEIKTIIDSVGGEEIEVLTYEETLQIEITGMKHDAGLSAFLSRLDSVKAPPPTVSESLDIRDIVKLQALQDFHLISKIENEETVDITVYINDSGRVVIKGQVPNVGKAKTKILLEVSKLARQEFEFPNKYYKELLKIPMVKDKIDVELSSFKSTKSMLWRISEERLTIVCLESVSADTVANNILSAIKEETFTFKGTVPKHSDSLKTRISQIKETYKQYSRLECSVNQKDVQITITCVDGFLDVLYNEFKAAIEPYLAKGVKIRVPHYIAKFMNDQLENEINSNLRSKGIEDVVQYKDGVITANATLETYKRIKSIFHAIAKQIHLEWVSHTMYGIDMYFSEKEGIDLLHSMEGSCGLQLLSKIEMKENSVHSVAVLESGTAIFALAGDLSHPIERVDVIVNPTDANMKHKKGASRAVAETGGKIMHDECSEYLNKNVSLKPNEVFVSSAGELRCQNVFHILEDTDQVGDSIKQILQIANDESNGIYRSIAMPLLGAGIGNQVNRSAKATMEVFRDSLRGNSNIRQVFLYDRNPKIVRIIQSEMHRVYGRNCFKMPMENVHVNKAKTLKPSEFHSLRRMGVRTIPLPGGKKLLLTWGELQNQKADVLVNPTASAPKPTGKISKSLCDAARRPDFQLEQECEKELKKKMANGIIPDGTVVDTPAGRLPCSTVFHLKIAYPWDGYNGKTNLQQYIKSCLWYAIKTNKKSIAFPTIGTADCEYPKNEVAQIFMRTVGEFMNKHSSTKLEEISVVIYKDDHESTMQFEETVSNIYSNRPHRLEAHIEEALILNKEGERHEEKEEKPKHQGNFNVARQIHPAPTQPRTNQGYSGGESKYKISSTAILSLVVENIENVTADVLVCTVFAGQFPKLHGAIAFALSKASGGAIQTECQQTYGAGLPQKDIPCTSGGGGLKCKNVFYILLEDYTSSADAAKIKGYVKQCLKKADSMNAHSICFPTIGTGNFKYPDFESAREMLNGVQEFFSSSPQTITKVLIALFRGAPNTVKAFQNEAQRVFQTISPPKGDQAQQPSKNTGNKYAVSIPNTLTTIEVFEGQLELTKADVILNTTTSFPNLNGAVPNALCRQGGQSIRDECQQYNGKVDHGDIIETKAGNLQCQSLFHYVLPDWDPVRGAKIIQNCMTKCLHLLTSNGFSSIALPAIGTGGYKYEPVKVAEGVFDAVKAYAHYRPGDKYKVMIVLFQPAQIVNKEILSYFQQPSVVDGSYQSAPQKKRVTFDDDADDKNGDMTDMSVGDQPKTDFVLLRLVSRDKKMIETTKKKISDRLKTDSEPLSITLLQHGEDVLKNKKHMKILEELCASQNVNIEVDLKMKEIRFKGVSPRKERCKEQVRSLLNDMADKKGNLVLAGLIQNVEWCYQESGGKILVPYPKSIAYNLETEKSRGAIEVRFKDTDGCEYMVDLNKMEEYKLEDDKRTSTIGVSRKDMATGELARFPDSWDAMVEDTNATVIPLDTNSPEYADVLKQFKKTLGNYRLNNVVQISRIQNKTLYHQYKIEKEKLDKANNGFDNEKTLWHGTAANKEKYITENGFNRSYAGGTFGGNVWYGQGVYFAVHSKYSADNNYSPADQNGLKRMFMVKVLTGEYAEVYKGYTDKYAPLKPGSNTERFDSVCDDIQNPQEFVIFRDTAAYPEYLISF